MSAEIAFQTHGATVRFYRILTAVLLRPFIITLVLDYQNDHKETELISQPQRLLTTNTELLTQNNRCLQGIEPCSVSRPEVLWWTLARGLLTPAVHAGNRSHNQSDGHAVSHATAMQFQFPHEDSASAFQRFGRIPCMQLNAVGLT